jgi:hypothetical protein
VVMVLSVYKKKGRPVNHNSGSQQKQHNVTETSLSLLQIGRKCSRRHVDDGDIETSTSKQTVAYTSGV